MKHDILVISPFFFPEEISTGKYNTHMVEALRDSGHKVTVVCSYPLYPKWSPEPTNETLRGVEVRRGGLNIKYPGSTVLRRLFLELWFALFVRKYIRKSKNNFTRVVLIYPPNFAGILAARVFANEKAKLIGIVHDLQGVLINAESGFVRRMVFGVVKKLEWAAFNGMDKLIYLSENMRASANRTYTNLKPTSDVAYPFVSIDERADSSRDYFNNDKINIVYSGALGEKQNPEGLLELFKELSKDSRLCCHIFSAGKIFDSLKEKAVGTNVRFNSLVPQKDLVSLVKSSSLQVVPQVLNTSDGAFPSKIPNIISLNIPLLCITPKNGELNRLLGSSGRALICENWDVVKIAKDVTRFLTCGSMERSYGSDLAGKFGVQDLVQKVIG